MRGRVGRFSDNGAMRRFIVAALALGCWCGAAFAADALLWFDGEAPSQQAREAVALLADAASDGLEPRDYDADALRRALAGAAQTPLAPAARARLDDALTAAMQRYLRDLHRGRVDPRQIGVGVGAPRDDAFDAAVVLREAVASRRLPEAAREAAPRLPIYASLRAALARYRALGDVPAWREPLPPLPAAARGNAKLEPGQPYAGLAQLAQRLAVLGDLPADAVPPASPPRYGPPLVAAVEAFQRRHGLADDGIVGKATLAQLQVTPAKRARQIELMLERLRWTPLLKGKRMIVVNIPEFVLRGYEVRDGRIGVRVEMGVIVGKAMDTRTPLLDEDMRYIEFSPYWNIPPSIARAETVPRLRRDPTYFEREGLEFVAPNGRVGTVLTEAQLDAVLAGALRIRQRPGPRNALGDIKFVFPNHDNIYLHHTPATQLFARDRRDFSHGCIRVEQPIALARFVLEGMPGWTDERIREAMEKGVSTTLRLAEPLPVLIAYGTALVKDGKVFLFDDIYGHDRRLDAALRARDPLRLQLE